MFVSLLGSGDGGLAGFTFGTGVTSAELRNGSRQLRGGGVSAAAEPNCPQASRRVSTQHTESVHHKRKGRGSGGRGTDRGKGKRDPARLDPRYGLLSGATEPLIKPRNKRMQPTRRALG